MKLANSHQLLLLNADKTYQDPLPFFMQSIIGAEDELLFGFEILYRGGTPRDWAPIDRSVIHHLCEAPAGSLPTFFINICNQAFLDIPSQRFVEAARKHTIYFELSDAQADPATWQGMTGKVQSLAADGVLFAHHNYGSDPIALQRVFAPGCISIIKVDSALLHNAMQNQSGTDALRRLVQQWRRAGIACIAERIETPLMLEFAQLLGFDYVQGFHIDAMLCGLDSQDLHHLA